jgi:transketolase
MRNTLINAIAKKMESNPYIYLLTGDLWWPFFYEFFTKFPDRCINVWIAEQNMIGIAAWLALEWKKVYCYSIVPFITMRAYEQVRVDICSHNLDVTLIGVGGGFAYGTLGNTHYGIEDINVMRWLPNMQIFCPVDKVEILAGLSYLDKNVWPTYIRLNRWWEADILSTEIAIDITRPVPLSYGGKAVIIFSTWRIWSTAKEVVEKLQAEWVQCSAYSIPLVKPINRDAILELVSDDSIVFSLEEHTIYGWLWSALAEIIAESSKRVQFKRFGMEDTFYYVAWDQEYMKWVAGIDTESIYNKIKSIL